MLSQLLKSVKRPPKLSKIPRKVEEKMNVYQNNFYTSAVFYF